MEGHTTVGSGCRVGPAATLKRSILLPGACVGGGLRTRLHRRGPGYHVPPGEPIPGGVLIAHHEWEPLS